MKNLVLILGILFLVGSVNAGSPAIRSSTAKSFKNEGYQFLQLSFIGATAPTTSALIWYGDNIAGFTWIDFSGAAVSTGTAITTINAQPVYSNGLSSGTAQTITSGTRFTAIKSPYYKFSIPAPATQRLVTLNFMIGD